ncbi:HNH endonuclease [Gordonia sp. (in: high G+C Gram-positive bacteria)]
MKASRAAFQAWVGEIPDGALVRHKCDNPPCINPAHLELGTKADNANDAVLRLRVANGERKIKSHKLSDEQVLEVRERYARGGVSQRDLAGDFGVSQQLVSHLVRGTRRGKPTNPPI